MMSVQKPTRRRAMMRRRKARYLREAGLVRFDEERSDRDESEGTSAASFGWVERPLSAGVDNPKVKRGAGRPGRVA
jgi:hypothetical protein